MTIRSAMFSRSSAWSVETGTWIFPACKYLQHGEDLSGHSTNAPDAMMIYDRFTYLTLALGFEDLFMSLTGEVCRDTGAD